MLSRKNKKIQNPIIRSLFVFFGVLFVFLGVIGIFLPGIPTTPFLLLAAWCFMRSSEKFYRWLLSNKLFGNYLRNYIEGKGISLKVKIGVLGILWISIGYLVIFTNMNIYIRMGAVIVAIFVSYHILKLKTYRVKDEIY